MMHGSSVFCPYCAQVIPDRNQLGELRLARKPKLILYYLLDRLSTLQPYPKLEAEFDCYRSTLRYYATMINEALIKQKKPFAVYRTPEGLYAVPLKGVSE